MRASHLTVLTLLLLLVAGSAADARSRADHAALRADQEAARLALWEAHPLHPANGGPSIRTLVPPEDAEILVIFSAPLVDVVIPMVIDTLAALDRDFAVWNTSTDGDVTPDLMSHDYEGVILFGDNTGILPTRGYDPDDPLVAYLMDGGNMFYSDQDYFWANDEPFDPVFDVGDLAYDAFGIGGGENDPGGTEQNYVGVEDDPISDPFADEVYVTNGMLTFDWEDNVWPALSADVNFTGANLDQGAGLMVENDWGGYTAFTSFNVLAAADGDWGGFTMTEQFTTLVEHISTWLVEGVNVPAALTLTPTQAIIPPTGGAMVYDLQFETFVPMTIPGVTYWTLVTMPNGQVFGPITQQMFTATPFMDVAIIGLQQPVPGIMPGGIYEFAGHVGFYPTPYLTDEFTFEKLGTAVDGDARLSVADIGRAMGQSGR